MLMPSHPRVRLSPVRYGVGVALLAIPAGGLIAAVIAGMAVLAIVCACLAVVIALATIADRLPLLHRIPAIGAVPAPTVEIGIEGGEGRRFMMRSDRPEDVIVRVGLGKRDRRRVITHMTLNVWVTGSDSISLCDQNGNPRTDRGGILPGDMGSYWALGNVNFTSSAMLLYFKVRIPRPGTYEAAVSIESPDMYGPDQITRRAIVAEPPGVEW